MALNFVEYFFERLFPSPRTADSYVSKSIVGSQNFMELNAGIFENIPSELQCLLTVDSNDTCRNKMMPLQSKLKTLQLFNMEPTRPSLVSQAPKLFLPWFSTFMKETAHFLSDELIEFQYEILSKLDLDEQNTIMRSIEISVPKPTVAEKLTGVSNSTENLSNTAVNCNKYVSILTDIKSEAVKPIKGCKTSLNEQMANKKTKELQKRSKKRRRRQKKTPCQNKLSKPCSSHNDVSCGTLCDIVSVSGCPAAVQLVIPELSSLFISLQSPGDEDSEWDACSDNEWFATGVEVTGLFMSNINDPSHSFANSCSPLLSISPSSKEAVEQIEQNYILLKVNKKWNQMTKEWPSAPKSKSKVMFAPEKDLVKWYFVDIYDRKGEWEVYASERLRFKRRINELDKIISPCLSKSHREKIFLRL